MKLLTANRTLTPNARRDTLEGREMLVVPAVALVPGVVNGELVQATEIAAFVDAWNGIPVTINHPIDAGKPVSANSKKFLESIAIGRFLNAEYTDRLKGELWIDVGKAIFLGGDAVQVLRDLEAGVQMELSTGYFTDVVKNSGTADGKPYTAIQTNLRPDHLALLPHEIGACSVADGCGANRVNTLGEKAMAAFRALAAAVGFQVNQPFAHGDLRSALRMKLSEALGPLSPSAFIEDVFDNSVVYSQDDKMFERPFSVDSAGKVTLGDPTTQVIRKTQYIAANAANQPQEAPTMDRTKRINELIECKCTRFNDQDRKFLEGLTDEQLERVGVSDEAVKALETVTANAAKPPAKSNPAPDLEKRIAALEDPEIRTFVQNELARAKAAKAAIIEKIVANKANALPKQTLEAMSQGDLEALERMLTPADYSGAHGSLAANRGGDNEVLECPAVVTAPREEKKEKAA